MYDFATKFPILNLVLVHVLNLVLNLVYIYFYTAVYNIMVDSIDTRYCIDCSLIKAVPWCRSSPAPGSGESEKVKHMYHCTCMFEHGKIVRM
jgi:hypothetical protein